jgi:hypothetical protein
MKSKQTAVNRHTRTTYRRNKPTTYRDKAREQWYGVLKLFIKKNHECDAD